MREIDSHFFFLCSSFTNIYLHAKNQLEIPKSLFTGQDHYTYLATFALEDIWVLHMFTMCNTHPMTIKTPPNEFYIIPTGLLISSEFSLIFQKKLVQIILGLETISLFFLLLITCAQKASSKFIIHSLEAQDHVL